MTIPACARCGSPLSTSGPLCNECLDGASARSSSLLVSHEAKPEHGVDAPMRKEAAFNCDVCQRQIWEHTATMGHPPAFVTGVQLERERCAKIVDQIIADAAKCATWNTDEYVEELIRAAAQKIREGK